MIWHTRHEQSKNDPKLENGYELGRQLHRASTLKNGQKLQKTYEPDVRHRAGALENKQQLQNGRESGLTHMA